MLNWERSFFDSIFGLLLCPGLEVDSYYILVIIIITKIYVHKLSSSSCYVLVKIIIGYEKIIVKVGQRAMNVYSFTISTMELLINEK